MKKDLLMIIAYFVKELKKQNLPISTTRIQKLLYLLDYFYYLENGRTYTGLSWKYHLYGPYSPQISHIIGEEFSNLKTTILPEKESENYFKKDPDFTLISKKVIKRFGALNLNELLNFVYEETEPINMGKRGECVDFSKIDREKYLLENIEIPSENVQKVLQAAKELKKHFSQAKNELFNSAPLENVLLEDKDEDSSVKIPDNIIIELKNISDTET